MPSTRTPGVTANAAGHHIIDKEHRGVRIYARLGAISEEEAQQRLAAEMDRVEQELQRKAARPIRRCRNALPGKVSRSAVRLM